MYLIKFVFTRAYVRVCLCTINISDSVVLSFPQGATYACARKLDLKYNIFKFNPVLSHRPDLVDSDARYRVVLLRNR